jgi:hypothetical protein
MKPRFTLQRMFLIITLAGVLLWFLLPVSAINRRAMDRITPGMTEEEAEEVVGLATGWYDGIGSAQLNAPDRGKGSMPHWLGMNGELVIIVDRNDRIVRTEFYQPRGYGWHLTEYLWERFTWLQVVKTPIPQRIVWYLALALTGTFVIGELFIRANSRKCAAWHGLAGLLLGSVLSIAIFSDGLSPLVKPDLTLEALLGPLVAALIGIMVGSARRALSPRMNETLTADRQATEPLKPKLVQIGQQT